MEKSVSPEKWYYGSILLPIHVHSNLYYHSFSKLYFMILWSIFHLWFIDIHCFMIHQPVPSMINYGSLHELLTLSPRMRSLRQKYWNKRRSMLTRPTGRNYYVTTTSSSKKTWHEPWGRVNVYVNRWTTMMLQWEVTMMRPGKRLYQTLIQTSVRMVSLTLEVPKSKIVEF